MVEEASVCRELKKSGGSTSRPSANKSRMRLQIFLQMVLKLASSAI